MVVYIANDCLVVLMEAKNRDGRGKRTQNKERTQPSVIHFIVAGEERWMGKKRDQGSVYCIHVMWLEIDGFSLKSRSV
jgi:hypothetical protein